MGLEEEAKELALRYVGNLDTAFSTLEVRAAGPVRQEDLSYVLDLANRYREDARRFLEAGRPLTSIAASSYAEGLLDALRFLGLVEFRWPGEREVRNPGGSPRPT